MVGSGPAARRRVTFCLRLAIVSSSRNLVSADLAFPTFDIPLFPPALIAGSIETRSQQIKASVVKTDAAYATAF